jgi:hypothetical protein
MSLRLRLIPVELHYFAVANHHNADHVPLPRRSQMEKPMAELWSLTKAGHARHARLHGHEAQVSSICADTDLSGAVGLENVRHTGPSTVGIDTVFRSGGNIPDVSSRKPEFRKI